MDRDNTGNRDLHREFMKRILGSSDECRSILESHDLALLSDQDVDKGKSVKGVKHKPKQINAHSTAVTYPFNLSE